MHYKELLIEYSLLTASIAVGIMVAFALMSTYTNWRAKKN